jgi:transcriptional regulator with GAF, ATPase, and Fis domain
MIGVLWSEDSPSGALVMRASVGCAFDDAHERMLEELLEPFAAALENDRRLHELAALREAAEADKRSALARLGRDDLRDTIIGAEEGLRPVMERVNLVARLDVPVLLLGETGTGKEVIARTIHEASSRSRGPFIRVNCGAIPPELIDSELFGHEKGAFTGATSSRRGWFERADNGTLLLDEVGELPLPAQVRLLRVLQEGSFERVGGERSVSVDVRIVASTHRDLPAMAQNGEFRQDLWYRIAGFPIVLPPLRERREDIPALAAHFADRAAKHFGLRPIRLAAEDVELLVAYDWPGNVRELSSVIDRAAILGDGEGMEVAAALGSPASGVPRRSGPVSGGAPAKARSALDEAIRKHIESALRACRGRIEGRGGAAERLDINPHTLRARMRKLGIEWKRFRDA